MKRQTEIRQGAPNPCRALTFQCLGSWTPNLSSFILHPSSFILFAACASLVAAEDSVTRVAKDGQTRIRSVGQIVDFTGDALILRHRSGREERIPPEEVVQLRSNWTTAHAKGDAQFEAGQFDAALQAYLEALRAEQRGWVRRLVLSRCVWCYRRLGQVDRAGEAFLAICQQDPKTPYYDAIPLAWLTARPSAPLAQQARQWLQNEGSAEARLMGASWLLSTAERPSAVRALRGLIDAPQPAVAFLAESQLWRTRVVTATAADADRWGERIERMPRAIRAGPHYVRGQLLSRHGRREEAALSFLRTAILFPDHHDLVAPSLLAAAEQLETMEQRDEAARLLAEIVTDYPRAAVADDARRRWQALQQQPAEP
ncbi:MAG: tol-pal system YbgF family protein [Pirellulaceae bacterium]